MLGIVLGLVFVAAGWLLRVRPRPGEVVTDGVVVECEAVRRYATRYYVIVYEFKDGSAVRRRFTPELDHEEPRRALGTRIRVGYLPADPEGTARQVDGSARWTPWFTVAVGAASVVVLTTIELLG